MIRFIARGTLIKRWEAAVIATGAVLLAILFDRVNAFEALEAFTRAHEALQLDEVLMVIFCGGGAAFLLALRRSRDLAREMARREAAEERALRLARHDPLTGLSNRRVLESEMPDALAEAERRAEQCAVFGIDLDHFKAINDVHGHDLGDAVLVEVAARLQRACPEGSLIARVGGDEFVVVASQEPGTDAPARTATRIIRALSEPYRIDERRFEIGATVGIARSPIDSTEPEVLLRSADLAMYDGKRAGKGTYRFFHADMDARLRARATLESELRGAIERGDIVPYFQPVMSLAENRIIGFEALARWHHPTRGVIAPDEFIQIAEDLGLIDALTTVILREGCIAARAWHPDTSLSINIAPMQLRDPWLAARLLAILSQYGMPPNRLIVEVTENAIIDDVEQAAELFQSLQNAGIRIALDDFGKGYSSLSHLRQLRFNHLKIDSSFVRSMDTVESQKIVSAVAGLGKALGMPVTAEGVERLADAEALRALGCEQAQGFYFGRPAPAEAAAHLLEAEDERAAMRKRA